MKNGGKRSLKQSTPSSRRCLSRSFILYRMHCEGLELIHETH
jgi:hypothetical protein